jgi:cardiolipin synthase
MTDDATPAMTAVPGAAAPATPPRTTIEGAPWTVFTEGDDLYEAMLADIRRATRSVRLGSYILASDGIGHAFFAELRAAAGRGVAVTVRADHAGSFFDLAAADIERLLAAGVAFRWNRVWSPRHPLRVNRRDHRKLLVVDEAVLYVGGFNLHAAASRRHVGPSRWRDTHLRAEGEVARLAARIFDDTGQQFEDAVMAARASGATRIIPQRSRRRRNVWRHDLCEVLRHARQRIWLTTPYFIPDRHVQRQLCRAAERGVDVRLLVPDKTDIVVTQWAARAVYARLLSHGVRIFEYLPRILHAKSLVVDGDWAAVGTANLDYRSFFVNDEVNLLTDDGILNGILAGLFLADLDEAREVRADAWGRRWWPAFVAEAMGWALRRWL